MNNLNIIVAGPDKEEREFALSIVADAFDKAGFKNLTVPTSAAISAYAFESLLSVMKREKPGMFETAIVIQDGNPDAFPQQPTHMVDGVLRYKSNALVRYMLDNGTVDMNKLAMIGASDEDRSQFAQLIGYSVSGFDGLSYSPCQRAWEKEEAEMERTGILPY